MEIETPRQLAQLLGGGDMLVWNHHEGDMDWCLCAVDVPRSLRGSGIRWRDDNSSLIIERTDHDHV